MVGVNFNILLCVDGSSSSIMQGDRSDFRTGTGYYSAVRVVVTGHLKWRC